MSEDTKISRIFKEKVSDIAERISDTEIQFTKTELWSISKQNLLDQKISIKNQISEFQKQLDEVDQLLAMFEK